MMTLAIVDLRVSCSATSATAGNIDILRTHRSMHHDYLIDLLCWSSQTMASMHGGSYLGASNIGNTDVCIHPRRVLRFDKLSTHLVTNGIYSIDFGIFSLLHGALTVSPYSSKAHPCTPTTWHLFTLVALVWLPRHRQS
jgi:hypothetical protein